MAPLNELEVLALVCERMGRARIDYMLTGSFALAYYATPRMTRDLDLVVACDAESVNPLVDAFASDFYIDADAVRTAVFSQRPFNLMHLDSGLKVDMIVRRDSRYRIVEFERRQRVRIGTADTWIVSREDLILSKLVWLRETNSELQRRDVLALAESPHDSDYLLSWADELGVAELWNGIRH